MATNIGTDARWVELSNMGYNLREKDGDAAVALYFKEAYITDFGQTSVTIEEIIKEAELHRQEITGNNEIKRCRNCEHWESTRPWKGNCKLHPWARDKYSEDATCDQCPDYQERDLTRYMAPAQKEATR